MTATGDVTVLHSFSAMTQGPSSLLRLVQASDGNFYGTTTTSGYYPDDEFTYGHVFRLSSAGVFSVLYTFTQDTDGQSPSGALIEAFDGNLYGATYSGGPNDGGTVFRISKAGTLATIYGFPGTVEGTNPSAPPIEGSDGALYGTTSSGGTFGKGTLFTTARSGLTTTLHPFKGGAADGESSNGLIEATDGYLYGTTATGGASGLGTIFNASVNGSLSILHHFRGGADGAGPAAHSCRPVMAAFTARRRAAGRRETASCLE